jgi:hypothetical protein
LTSAALIVALALFAWIAVTAATDPDSPPGGPPAIGATPLPPTPTLPGPAQASREEAEARIRQEGAGQVLDLALASDVDGLLGLIEWEMRPCDAPEVVWHRCAEAGVDPGTPVQVTQLETGTGYYDRTFVAAFQQGLLADDSELVFAARTPEVIGISFALPAPINRPVGGGSPLQGIWFDIRPGAPPVIQRIYFFTPTSGPRQFYQVFYQPEGGELWYFDEQRAPGTQPVPTPDAPR